MAITDAAEILVIGPERLAEAQALSDEAGWNEGGDDWLMMLRQGRTFGLAGESGGRLVATALALPYAAEIGWISMVLVTAAARRQGIASRLMQRCLDELRGRGLLPLLDATPAGRPVYEKLGFLPHWGFQRWRGRAAGPARKPASLRDFTANDLSWATALDAAAMGAARPAILTDLSRRDGFVGMADAEQRSFAFSRRGRRSTQIGPIVGADAGTALALLDAMLARLSGEVIIDVPDAQLAFGDHLAAAGFRIERPFTRMCAGRGTALGQPALIHAVAGPELG